MTGKTNSETTKDANTSRPRPRHWSMLSVINTVMAIWVATFQTAQAHSTEARHPGHGISPSLLLTVRDGGEGRS